MRKPYDGKSIDELIWLRSNTAHYELGFGTIVEALAYRQGARDAILDMAEGLDTDGLVVVPRALVAEAAFLTDRIEDFELDETDAKGMCREFCGHVLPSHERLLKLLAAAPLAPEVG